MKRRMLHAAVIEINRHPILQRFFGCECAIIMRIAVAHEVPRRPCPVRHSIRFTFRFASAMWTRDFNPLAHLRKRRLPVLGRLIAFHVWEQHWKLFFWNRNVATRRTDHDRNRLTPISLTGKNPITKFIIRRRPTLPLLRKPRGNLFLLFGCLETIEKTGINIDALTCVTIRRLVFNTRKPIRKF